MKNKRVETVNNLPSMEYERFLDCIHCGFCLPTCPTYAILGTEMDSPRGRAYSMRALEDERIEISQKFSLHIDRCLGCFACETACPSGVRVGEMLEKTRSKIELYRKRPLLQRLFRRIMFRSVLPSRFLLGLAFCSLWFYQRSGLQQLVRKSGLLRLLPAGLRLIEPLTPTVERPVFTQSVPEKFPVSGKTVYRIGLFLGCINDQLYRHVNQATCRVLQKNNCEIVTPPQQTCCGALQLHAGDYETTKKLAKKNIDVFLQHKVDFIIVNVAGCSAVMKEYDRLLADDPEYSEKAKRFSSKVKDVIEFLAEIPFNGDLGMLQLRVTYHDACHLAHAQNIRKAPRLMLKMIPGLELIDLPEADWCCGSAGIYNIMQPQLSSEILSRKIENIISTNAEVVAMGNAGCIFQIQQGLKKRGVHINVCHTVELLDQSYSIREKSASPVC